MWLASISDAPGRSSSAPISGILADPYMTEKQIKMCTEIYDTGVSGKILDNEIIRKDGSTLYTELNVTLIRDAKGKPVGIQRHFP